MGHTLASPRSPEPGGWAHPSFAEGGTPKLTQNKARPPSFAREKQASRLAGSAPLKTK